MKDLHKILFQVVREYVFAGGGDGNGLIVCKEPGDGYVELANEFEKYEKSLPDPFFTHRYNNEDTIVFANGQESIVFRQYNDGSGCEITVEVYW